MNNPKTTIEPSEVAKFAQHANHWWDTQGPLKTLHDINPARIAFIQKYTSLTDKKILDLGCGGGILSEALAIAGAHVTGLDVEPSVIQVAKQHASDQDLKIIYVCEPVEEYLLVEETETKQFDIITCMEMLEHVPDLD